MIPKPHIVVAAFYNRHIFLKNSIYIVRNTQILCDVSSLAFYDTHGNKQVQHGGISASGPIPIVHRRKQRCTLRMGCQSLNVWARMGYTDY